MWEKCNERLFGCDPLKWQGGLAGHIVLERGERWDEEGIMWGIKCKSILITSCFDVIHCVNVLRK